MANTIMMMMIMIIIAIIAMTTATTVVLITAVVPPTVWTSTAPRYSTPGTVPRGTVQRGPGPTGCSGPAGGKP